MPNKLLEPRIELTAFHLGKIPWQSVAAYMWQDTYMYMLVS